MPADIYGLIAEKRGEILAVAERYGITNVRVFGSVARHEAREDSDLDLLVTFPPTASLFDLIGLEQDLTELLGLEVRSPPTVGSGAHPRDRHAGSGAAVRPDRDRLTDILEAIEKIRERLPATLEELTVSELLQVWVVYHLQVIGEAANNLSPALVAARPEIPWKKVVALRHVLVHRYFGVDLAIVWRLVTDDLPALEASVRAILKELP